MIAGRNQRPAKGLKVKHAIQIALILAVCFWLLYQMKQSHGKDYSESSKGKASEAVLIFSDVRGVQGGQKVEVCLHQKIQNIEVHGFDDVNGLPVDGHDLIEYIVTGTGGDHAITGHQEMNSGSNNQSEIRENKVNEEVGSKVGTAGADLEAKSKISVQDSNSDIKAKVETGSDTSRIDTVEEATQGGSSVSDS
ncbi:unnamed protein product [Malus baccata var. baccata]